LTGLFNHSYAQQANSKSTATNTVAKDEKPSPANLVFNPDENVVTEHTTTKRQLYRQHRERITDLLIPERSDVKDRASRPLVISFNGGPGSASVWMHIAYTGPNLLNIDDEGYPLQPYGIKENPYSILDV
jgi:carboxypeptidase C (cathepsin A)